MNPGSNGSDLAKVAAMSVVRTGGARFVEGDGPAPEVELVCLVPMIDADLEAEVAELEFDSFFEVAVRLRGVDCPEADYGLAVVPSELFESLVPLQSLMIIPNDLSALESSEPMAAPSEIGCLEQHRQPTEITSTAKQRSIEGMQLARLWRVGRRPVRRTLAFLLDNLSDLPMDLAEPFVYSWQLLKGKRFHADARHQIGALCFAIADHLQGRW